MYINCPVTGNLLSTGVDVYDIIPENLTSKEVTCYYCDQIHSWKAEDVVFMTRFEGKNFG